MTPPPGFEVQPDVLDEGARQLAAVAAEICGARETLINNGDLPTLDPLSKAVSVAAGILSIPLVAVAGAVADAIDPYPPIRHAWEDALARYCKMVGDDAQRLRDTAEAYRRSDEDNEGRIDDSYTEPVPIPTVPGRPTVPMPTVPGEPTVPMPEVEPGAGSGPVNV